MKKSTKFLLVVFTLFVSACGGGKKTPDVEVDQGQAFEDQKALAVVSSWKGNFQQALEEIEVAEKMNNKDPEVYLIKGAIYTGLKDNAGASQYYKQALALDPHYTPAHFNLCGLYLLDGNYDGVIAECSEVVNDPTYKARANAYTNIGLAYFHKGDMTRARENYEAALNLNPSFVYAHNELGKLYLSTGRYADAILEFQQAVAGLPSYEEAYYNLGLAYLKTNDTENACRSFRKVVEISPGSEFGVNSNRYINTVCR
jgi:Tfp pilus assembly protein PilF